MDSKQLIAEKYKALCEQRGHLQNNLDKISKELTNIVEQIEALDLASGVLISAEKTTAQMAATAAAVKAELSEK